MAHGVLNIMGENYEALESVFKGMGVLDMSKPDLRRPGVEEPFTVAIQRCMTGGADAAGEEGAEGAEGEAASAAPQRRKIVQDADGGNRRRAFGQLYEELSELYHAGYAGYRDTLLGLVSAINAGRLHPSSMEILGDSYLYGLEKADGGTRPIGVTRPSGRLSGR